MIYIASLGKNTGKIEEDIMTLNYFLSLGYDSEIRDVFDIEKRAVTEDVVILKSIWGYYKDPEKFLSTIRNFQENNIKLVNDYPFVYWNMNKYSYLEEIKGIGIIPTWLLVFKECYSVEDIKEEIDSLCNVVGENVLVVKPVISASGFLTVYYDKRLNNQDLLENIFENRDRDFIAQPYRSSIKQGELSLVILEGEVCYGINRFPGVMAEKKKTEFVPLEQIPEQAKKQANDLFKFFKNKFSSIPDICRLDFLTNIDRYEIIEVELIDPSLSFRDIPEDVRNKSIQTFINFLKNQK